MILAAVAIAALLAGQAGWLQGSAPDDLGVRDGRLKPPSITANSVSSQAGLHTDHPMRQAAAIEPLRFTDTPSQAMQRLRQAVEAYPGARLVEVHDTYLRASFETRWLRFVDDAEFLLDASQGVVHVRSASRLGQRDFGVNRQRIEALRAQFEAQPPGRLP